MNPDRFQISLLEIFIACTGICVGLGFWRSAVAIEAPELVPFAGVPIASSIGAVVGRLLLGPASGHDRAGAITGLIAYVLFLLSVILLKG